MFFSTNRNNIFLPRCARNPRLGRVSVTPHQSLCQRLVLPLNDNGKHKTPGGMQRDRTDETIISVELVVGSFPAITTHTNDTPDFARHGTKHREMKRYGPWQKDTPQPPNRTHESSVVQRLNLSLGLQITVRLSFDIFTLPLY